MAAEAAPKRSQCDQRGAGRYGAERSAGPYRGRTARCEL